jgi:hypothetical protein
MMESKQQPSRVKSNPEGVRELRRRIIEVAIRVLARPDEPDER